MLSVSAYMLYTLTDGKVVLQMWPPYEELHLGRMRLINAEAKAARSHSLHRRNSFCNDSALRVRKEFSSVQSASSESRRVKSLFHRHSVDHLGWQYLSQRSLVCCIEYRVLRVDMRYYISAGPRSAIPRHCGCSTPGIYRGNEFSQVASIKHARWTLTISQNQSLVARSSPRTNSSHLLPLRCIRKPPGTGLASDRLGSLFVSPRLVYDLHKSIPVRDLSHTPKDHPQGGIRGCQRCVPNAI
jgi:hypothetical protein